MSWLQKLMSSRIRTTDGGNKQRTVPEGLWEKCDSCAAVLYRPEMERNLDVCPKCGNFVGSTDAPRRIPPIVWIGAALALLGTLAWFLR